MTSDQLFLYNMVDQMYDLISEITTHLHGIHTVLNVTADTIILTYQIVCLIKFRKEVSGKKSYAMYLAPNEVLIQCFLQILISNI